MAAMATTPDRPAPSATARRLGWTLTTLFVLFMLFDISVKVLQPPEAASGVTDLGWTIDAMLPLGIVQVVMLVLYLVPRTAVLGAILWTGYLGGAVATHVRISNPLFSHILFPIYVALFLWGGLYLRERRVRAFLLG